MKKYNIGIRMRGHLDSSEVFEAKSLLDALSQCTDYLLKLYSDLKQWQTRLISEVDENGKVLRRGNGKFD